MSCMIVQHSWHALWSMQSRHAEDYAATECLWLHRSPGTKHMHCNAHNSANNNSKSSNTNIHFDDTNNGSNQDKRGMCRASLCTTYSVRSQELGKTVRCRIAGPCLCLKNLWFIYSGLSARGRLLSVFDHGTLAYWDHYWRTLFLTLCKPVYRSYCDTYSVNCNDRLLIVACNKLPLRTAHMYVTHIQCETMYYMQNVYMLSHYMTASNRAAQTSPIIMPTVNTFIATTVITVECVLQGLAGLCWRDNRGCCCAWQQQKPVLHYTGPHTAAWPQAYHLWQDHWRYHL